MNNVNLLVHTLVFNDVLCVSKNEKYVIPNTIKIEMYLCDCMVQTISIVLTVIDHFNVSLHTTLPYSLKYFLISLMSLTAYCILASKYMIQEKSK